MYTHLKDIVRYVHDVGVFQNILLAAKDDGEALFQGMSTDGTLALRAIYKTPLPQIRNQKIGVTRLDVLSAFLRSPAFNDADGSAPTIEIVNRTGKEVVPSGIQLKSTYGHTAVFRFLSPTLTKSKITVTKSSAEVTDDDINFIPDEKFFGDFKSFSAVLKKFNSTFSLEVKDDVLYMNLGEDDTACIPVNDIGEGYHINPTYTWSIDNFLRVLKQAPSMEHVKIGISEEFGMIEVVIDDENVKATYRLLHN